MRGAAGIERRASPNHGARAAGKPIDILLLHYTGMPNEQGALEWLCSPRSEVSAHYFVRENGTLVQMVDETRRAWHAGRSAWAGETDINSRSIGIEVANPGLDGGHHPFPSLQIASLIDLCLAIVGRHPISAERVLAHSDVAPMRKRDPGELFPWERLNKAGIGHWVAAAPALATQGEAGRQDIAASGLRKRFRRYGYGLAEEGDFDDELRSVVTAFQRHFRPQRVDGIADRSTVETLDRLLAALPAGA